MSDVGEVLNRDHLPLNWDNPDASDAPSNSDYGAFRRRSPGQRAPSPDSMTLNSQSMPPPPTKPGSPPRSSSESAGRASSSRWRDSLTTTLERRDTYSTAADTNSIVEPNFDENILRALCDLDCGVPLLLDRIKQSMVSCREASVFFKKRAVLEEEYGRSMQKLAKTSMDVYSTSDGKAGSFVTAWQASLRVHEILAENRIRFAQRLNEMSEELATLAKEVDKNRKQTKDLATRYERALSESEMTTEKCKSRFDATAEELERILLQKEGESFKDNAVQGRSPGGGGKRVIGKVAAKGGMLLKGKNPGNLHRQEDDIRSRMSAASDAYRKSVTETQSMRQEYFNFQLPRILRALKECSDEVDLGTQYHLTRYAFLFENTVLSDGSTLAPVGIEEGPGLKATIETIDNRTDFRVYMQNYAYAHGSTPSRGPRRQGPEDEGFLPPLPTFADKTSSAGGSPATSTSQIPDKGRPTFGVDLAEQMARDNAEVPCIMEKCCEAIEKYGLRSQGIYRISGTMTKVTKLKEKLDKDMDSVDLDAPEWATDINNVTSVLKLWLRELPDPLLTYALHQPFIESAKIENDRLRHIRLHERVNELPDPNYATLKYFLGHLYRITQFEPQNQMSVQNIAIVFGPTLFGVATTTNGTNGQSAQADATFQNKAIETILEHYTDIFVDESEDP
ncbi:hypothetical protein JAAARDRAFT_199693 [Jaapia argillacea MUCL 33604]|uniref:Rho-GAP domain-containing protein n=1 Tax=Jaapia argillacea MUCL 33604 TaxID=933084 RepID=A0A067P718_9AGAM|nr:hypothetical protein JAAARDRAFT_199693 [Jaapia argillacea MUCL 33604]